MTGSVHVADSGTLLQIWILGLTLTDGIPVDEAIKGDRYGISDHSLGIVMR